MPARKGSIRLNIVDGARQDVGAEFRSLVRVLDGRKRQLATQWVSGPTVMMPGITLADNPDDWYTIVVHADGFQDSAVYPVALKGGKLIDAYVMMLRDDAAFHFPRLEDLKEQSPQIFKALENGAGGNLAAFYKTNVEDRPNQLGALLTILCATQAIPLGEAPSDPLSYYWEILWDALAPDRLWAWADVRLADRIQKLAELNGVAEERDPGHWHPGLPAKNIGPATRSWKQTRFDVTNVQLTFHENSGKNVEDAAGGTRTGCVIVEPDIDLYKDLLAHGLLEVLPNAVTKGKTNPLQVYALRWMAGKQEGLPDFAPPCTVE